MKNSAASAAASLKQADTVAEGNALALKFRGICRGLIEARPAPGAAVARAAKFRGICRGLIEAPLPRSALWRSPAKFRGICRGLIEAHHPPFQYPTPYLEIPRHLPRPH